MKTTVSLFLLLAILGSGCATIRPKTDCRYWTTLIVFNSGGQTEFAHSVVVERHGKGEAGVIAAETHRLRKTYADLAIVATSVVPLPCKCNNTFKKI